MLAQRGITCLVSRAALTIASRSSSILPSSSRVEALLRRIAKENHIPARTFQFEDVEMDFTRSEVRRAGQPVTLGARELDLIRYLVQHRDRVVPREENYGTGRAQ
jgi:hypothetical protein